MVDSKGIILYHPVKEKVGEPVENQAIKDIAKRLGDKVNDLIDESNDLEVEDGEIGTTLKRLPYLRNVNGTKFVLPAKAPKFDPLNKNSFIHEDKSGKAIYIVAVDEAPSTPKLNLESATSYSKLPDTKDEFFKTEEIARAVAKVLGTKDTYIKDAYTEILKGYDFTFYETSLYEHFKSEYPDLFDTEE